MDCPTFSDTGVQLPIQAKAIAFDLDGTLLDFDGYLRESVAKMVRLISSSGIKVFLVTGRQQSGCERYWRDLGLGTPIAACNGAYVGFPDAEPFLHIRLGERARDIILDLEEKHGLYINYYIDNHIYTQSDSPERDWYSRQFSLVEKAVDRSDIAHRRLPTKCLCITPESDQRRVSELFGQALGTSAVITHSSSRFIEILSPEADKGVGLQALAHWADIGLEHFIAVGDAMNDLPMLALAGFSVSFKSGNPKLFDKVDMLLPPLWEDGMDILAKCVLGLTNLGRFLTPHSTRFFKKK